MRGPFSISLTTFLLSFSTYNLIASGDYRHLSFSFCNESLPRINFVILFSCFSPSKTFPNLVHSSNINSSTEYLIKLRRPSGILYLFFRIKHLQHRSYGIQGTALISKEKLDKTQTRPFGVCSRIVQIRLPQGFWFIAGAISCVAAIFYRSKYYIVFPADLFFIKFAIFSTLFMLIISEKLLGTGQPDRKEIRQHSFYSVRLSETEGKIIESCEKIEKNNVISVIKGIRAEFVIYSVLNLRTSGLHSGQLCKIADRCQARPTNSCLDCYLTRLRLTKRIYRKYKNWLS